MIDIAEEEITYAQYGNVTLSKRWYLAQEDISQSQHLGITLLLCAMQLYVQIKMLEG